MPPPPGSWNPVEGPADYTMTKEVHNDTYPAIDPTKANMVGRAVLIVGASKGLGAAMAVSFARAGASQIAIGARSSLTSIAASMKKAAVEAGRSEPQVLMLELDVTSQSSIEAAASQVSSAFGKLDVLIHNSGVLEGMKPITDTDPDEWWRTWEVNVRGPYLISRSFIPLLLKGETKTLVVISSVGAHVVLPGLSAYQPSKLAATRLVEFAAVEYRDQGLVAISVHPGNIMTDMAGTFEMEDKLRAIFTESPELSADSLVYLTKEHRPWLSGRYINLTWDLPELTNSPKKDEIIAEDKLKVRLVV
ncbi:hypothetical protein LTR17_027092 [Elasticomyces elasticus]|nr:hypothetical protein LTR17_027092 [Elasticomyces elasticus]